MATKTTSDISNLDRAKLAAYHQAVTAFFAPAPIPTPPRKARVKS